jgi:hypothetical protein
MRCLLISLQSVLVIAACCAQADGSSAVVSQSSWIDFIKGVTGPIIGGLAVGVLVYWVQKARESRTTTVAILSEIRTLLEIDISHLKWFRGRVLAHDLQHELIPLPTPVYDAQIANIGVLNRTPVPDVVAFYSYLKFLNALQRARVIYIAANRDYVFLKVYHSSLTNLVERFGTAFDRAFSTAGVQGLDRHHKTTLAALIQDKKDFLAKFPHDSSFGDPPSNDVSST